MTERTLEKTRKTNNILFWVHPGYILVEFFRYNLILLSTKIYCDYNKIFKGFLLINKDTQPCRGVAQPGSASGLGQENTFL